MPTWCDRLMLNPAAVALLYELLDDQYRAAMDYESPLVKWAREANAS